MHVEKKTGNRILSIPSSVPEYPSPNKWSPFIHVRNQNQISVSFMNYGQPHRWNSERARYIYKLIRTHIVVYFKNHWPFHWFQNLKGKMKLEYKNFPWDLWGVKIVLRNNKTKKWRLSTIKKSHVFKEIERRFLLPCSMKKHGGWKRGGRYYKDELRYRRTTVSDQSV